MTFGKRFAYTKGDGGEFHCRPVERDRKMKEEKMTNMRISPDLDGDGQIKQWEWDLTTNGLKKDQNYEVSADDKTYAGSLDKIFGDLKAKGKIIATAGDVKDPKQVLEMKMTQLGGSMEALKLQIETAKQQGQEEQVKQLQEQLRQQIMVVERLNNYAVRKMELGNFRETAEVMESERQFGMRAQTLSGNGAETQTSAKAATAANASYLPAGFGAQNFAAQVDPSAAYTQALAMESNVMSSWDDINKNTQQGKRLMMLFFYFAKMAESGDMGAMYQFIKFITFIITKDKAKQQIEMSKKIIQMQELSRQVTNKMYQISVPQNDPNYSNELMKTMTLVKSETDSLATSMKLGSQMMEEFAQVSEVLHNVLRSTVDSYKRISNTVSRAA